MNPNLILCPNCNSEISIPEVLRKQNEERIRKDVVEENREKFEIEKEEAVRKQREEDLQKNKMTQDRLKELQEKNEKILQESLSNLKEKNKLEDQLKERDIEEEKRLREASQKAREEATAKANENHRLKESQFEQTNLALKKQLDDALQKIEQGSQQTQGEVLELELEELLKTEFPNDDIKPVPKGMRGADVIQTIHSSSGDVIGKIIWESKRAKEFGKDWIKTLKMNSVQAGADVAILVTTVMPEEIKYFGPKGGVYISSIACIKEVARLIRGTLLKVYKSREDSVEKKDILWTYLTSPQFAQKFSVIIDNYIAEKDDIDKEERAFVKKIAEKKKRMERTMHSLAMIYGDLQGLLGASLPQIASLEITTTRAELELDSNKIYIEETKVVADNFSQVNIDELSNPN